MDGKKKYTKADLDRFSEAVKRECESTLIRQRERIESLRAELAEAEKKIAKYESQKELIYKAITAAVRKADDIERVSLIKYNQEIAQLKSFHSKWVGYFNKIIERYPLSDELVAASRVNERIAEVLDRTGDIDAQYESERDRLRQSVDEECERNAQAESSGGEKVDDDPAPPENQTMNDAEGRESELSDEAEAVEDTAGDDVTATVVGGEADYADRSPAGFSFAEALHPKEDLKDIMKELGIIMDED